ncbi:MAG: TIGR04053 family radical SAM/SPASM domain-containing protein [Pirellulales bacterium]|nr:TIGR04053 family radical SAM/SPASM domain-containing protein [Pirellulales bacterium]
MYAERRRSPVASRRDLSLSPLLVFYEVTRACDLVCTHCRACAEPAAHPEQLSTEQSLRLIEVLSEFPAPPHLVLTGGDPLKRADLFELIEHARWFGVEVSITPSATPLATRSAIRRLHAAGASRLAVSIDGPDAASHDATRGVAGSFRRSLQMLADAHEEGFSTQVNTVLTPGNVEAVDEMAELLASLNIALWSVFFLVPTGRALSASRLTADACEAAFERLWLQSLRQSYAIKTTEAPHFRRFAAQRRSNLAASAPAHGAGRKPLHLNDGKGVMFVSHTGQIMPSGFLPIVCGRHPQDHLVAVYQQSPAFVALRDADRLEGKCRRCEYRFICGGSRARAYAVSGNLLASEPDCLYEPPTATPC